MVNHFRVRRNKNLPKELKYMKFNLLLVMFEQICFVQPRWFLSRTYICPFKIKKKKIICSPVNRIIRITIMIKKKKKKQ